MSNQIAFPAAAAAWPPAVRQTIDAMLDRGHYHTTISRETKVPQADLWAYRRWYQVHGAVWPGPREVAVAIVTACRLTGEDPVSIMVGRWGPSHARNYAIHALTTRYPAVDRKRLCAAMGPPGATDTRIKNLAYQYARPNPAGAMSPWWRADVAAAVFRAISQTSPAKPFPAGDVPPSGSTGDSGDTLPSPKQYPLAVIDIAKHSPQSGPDSPPDPDAMKPKPDPKPRPSALSPLGFVADDPLGRASPAARAVLGLTLTCCRWPLGEPREADFRFCGAPARDEKSPYCADHMIRNRRQGTA